MAETFQIILTEVAKKDINDILDYLLEEVSYKEAVDTRQKILSAIGSFQLNESLNCTKIITTKHI